MDKTFTVVYKNGKIQNVTGNVILFSSTNTVLTRVKNAVYLNADHVVSMTEQAETGEGSVDSSGC